MDDCIFCKILNGDIPAATIYEDDDFLAFLDIAPVNKGHALVIPKTHCSDFLETPDAILAKAMPVVKKVARALEKAVQADGFVISTNVRPAAGQVVFHTHIHIIPRFTNDGHTHWHGAQVSSEEMKEVQETVKELL